ncbi:MAG: M28 family metallopeptidase [Xanthomonadales bacterium]|nr:M28 family metallopeptidase [Xanthomonadales bacterium]
MIGAHYDSRNEQPCDASQAPAPGANDNASGCAGVIELANAFAPVATDRSLVFACFSGEEQGLHGSRAFVQTLVADGRIAGVRHMVNLDMIGHAVDASLAARAETRAEFASWLAVYGQAAATYAPELGLQLLQSTAAYSDHWPFLERGVPAVFTWENGASIYPHWHRSSDRPENMLRARELARGILRMDAAVIAELAGVWGVFADGFEAP